MTISFSPARPFAALTALAVIAAGVAFAPVATASAASASSQASSIISKVNGYRSSAKLAKVKTQNDLNEFALDWAEGLAKAKSTDIEAVDYESITIQPYITGEAVYKAYRVKGGSSTVIKSVASKLKAGSSKSDKTFVYGKFNYAGIGLKKSGSYTYAFIFFTKLSEKLQDSKAPRISGTAAVGKTLKVDMNGWKVGGGTRDYSWTADNSSVSEGNAPLVITPELVGKRIRLVVTVQREGYYTVARIATASAKVVLGTIATTPTPKVTGSRVVGESLLATAGTWSSGTELSYQWKRDGVAITDATSLEYEQVAADRGKKITVTVRGIKPGYKTVSKTSASPSATLGVFTAPTPETSVSGSTAGSTFSVTVGTWSPAASKYTYQWYRDGAAISKATAKTYVTVAADVDKSITVKVTGTKTGYKTLSVTSAPFYFGTSS